jgi:biopolymer transport protein ExbB/TolQ
VEPHNFSIYGMYMSADPVVKGVMILLALASVACWAVVIEKLVRMLILRRDLAELDAAAAGNLAAASRGGLAKRILAAAQSEAEDGAARGEGRSEIRARLERAMRAALKTEIQRNEIGLPLLATVGSAAPFIGLFGTVWGIMNSFVSISQKQDTSLATVAPGIAEALFATALGLAAAIPAVMAYNHFAVKFGRAAARGGSAITELAKIISKPQPEAAHRGVVEPIRAGIAH